MRRRRGAKRRIEGLCRRLISYSLTENFLAFASEELSQGSLLCFGNLFLMMGQSNEMMSTMVRVKHLFAWLRVVRTPDVDGNDWPRPGVATIFVRGPHHDFMSISRATFQSKIPISS